MEMWYHFITATRIHECKQMGITTTMTIRYLVQFNEAEETPIKGNNRVQAHLDKTTDYSDWKIHYHQNAQLYHTLVRFLGNVMRIYDCTFVTLLRGDTNNE